jgi:glycosyltransferase involved in cell wall biosynthesis
MANRVSVVTPSYNQGAFIRRTIESVLSQEFGGDLEYLIFDGGSSDQTVSILKEFESKVVWVSEKDRGQAHAVNKGLSKATGDVIGWLNSDDVYYPGAIASVLRTFELHPEVDVIYGNANHINEKDDVIEPYPTEEWNMERLLNTCYICQPALFLRKSVVDRFGILDEKLHFCLDYEYWIRLASRGAKFHWAKEVLAGSRLYAENKTLGSRVKVHREINDMLSRQAGRVPDRWLYNYAHVVLDEKGVSRERRLRFSLMVSWLSLYSSLRWNRGFTSEMLKTTSAWSGAAIKESWKTRGVK